ncbi:MAG TPA: Na+/H+ antiporter [Mycobacteriales bacterium]
MTVLATVVATMATRLRVPAPSLLVVAGIGVGLLPGVPAVSVSPELVSLVVLPPLIYAASIDVAVPELRAVLRPVVVLAVGLVLVSAFAVAVVVRHLVPEVPFAAALVLGAVLASTDPVAVSALARRLQLPPRLLTLVQSESLFNDATSLVLFRVAVSVALAGASGGPGPLGIAGQFVLLGGGGALIGLAVGVAVAYLRRRTEDAVLETLIALITPYAAFVLAELAHASGVTAVVAAGLWLGSRGVRLTSGTVRLQVETVYSVLVFLLESVVFAVIGLQLPGLVRALPDAGFVRVALAVTGVLLLTRILFLIPFGLVRAEPGDRRPWPSLAVVWWAGARGVVPLAAALSIPETTAAGAPFPERDLLLVLATSCIVLTLVVQGFTLQPLVRRLGVTDDPARTAAEEALARHAAAVAARDRLRELLHAEAVPPAVADGMLRTLEQRVERAARQLRPAAAPDRRRADPDARLGRDLRRDLLAVETAELLRLRDSGRISEDVRRRVQRTIDRAEAGLAED